MRCTFCWAVFALLIASFAIEAKQKFLPIQPVNPAPLVAEKIDPSVDQLIKDLASEDYRTREKAGRELVAKGEKVLPSLRAALNNTENPEAHRRLLVMVRKMDYDRLVAPKVVTMTIKDKPIKHALDEITKQTGYKINFGGQGGPESKYSFEFDKVPFWQAVDKVATAAGCVIFNNDFNDDTIQIYNQEAINPYVAYAGPFRFLATNIQSNKNVQLSGINRQGGGVNRQEYMNLAFQIMSEPKNPMLGVNQVDLIAATDEFGGSLVPPKDQFNRSYYYHNGNFRGHNMYGNLNLGRSDKTATMIKMLKGKASINLLSGTVPEIIVTDPLKVTNKTFSGRTLEIEFASLKEVANNKGHYQLELTAKKLGDINPNHGEYFNWINSVWQKVELLDEAGNRYHTFGANSINNNGVTVQISLPFGPEDRRTGQAAKLGPPTKVVVNEWQSVTHEVTFEFRDIPLP
jgi:hypothetical protein